MLTQPVYTAGSPGGQCLVMVRPVPETGAYAGGLIMELRRNTVVLCFAASAHLTAPGRQPDVTTRHW
jgi:hypothetical protein